MVCGYFAVVVFGSTLSCNPVARKGALLKPIKQPTLRHVKVDRFRGLMVQVLGFSILRSGTRVGVSGFVV